MPEHLRGLFMKNSKIVFKSEKDDKFDKHIPLKKDELYIPEDEKKIPETKPVQETEAEDEEVWGNDSDLNRKLDADVLLEKRKYVRVRYIQNIICSKICTNIEDEQVELDKPIHFTVFDISMGGLGCLCSHEIEKGAILVFNIALDQFIYEITCIVVYCIKIEQNYRVGLRLAIRNKDYIRHLKIMVARLSLTSKYGQMNSGNTDMNDK